MQYLKDNALWYAVYYENYSLVKFLINVGANTRIIGPIFSELCDDGDIRVIDLINAGVDVRTDDDAALAFFIKKGDTDNAKKLIELGANVNKPQLLVNAKYKGRMLRLLLDSGLDVTRQEYRKMFYSAVINWNVHFLELLCRGHNFIESFGGKELRRIVSIFCRACDDKCDPRMVQCLLLAGISKDIKNNVLKRSTVLMPVVHVLLDDAYVPCPGEIMFTIHLYGPAHTISKMMVKRVSDMARG